MAIRREPTYLSTDVFKALWLLAQSRGSTTDDQGLPHTASADEMADTMLREAITEKHPLIFEHLKKIRKMDGEFIKTLGGGT
jgi:hypothetical protein